VVFGVIQDAADGRRIATLAGDTLVVQLFVQWTSAIIRPAASQRSAAPRRFRRTLQPGRLPDRVRTPMAQHHPRTLVGSQNAFIRIISNLRFRAVGPGNDVNEC
jgi:hypothetical protein